MKNKFPMICAVLVMLALPVTAAATNTVLSGVFDGSEMATGALPGGCGAEGTLKYQVISSVTVSASGEYYIFDAYNFYAGDVTAMLYTGQFNPNAPLSTTITPDGIDVDDVVNLTAGTNYTVVVQHWCQNSEGAWALTFTGPGEVSSNRVVQVPAMTEGSIAGGGANLSTGCGDTPYQQSGPVQVAQDGMYYFSDVLENYFYSFNNPDAMDICLHIYTAPVNTANPGSNLVASLDIGGTVELESGRDYYFVVQGWGNTPSGDYLYVFAPPAPFRINHALAGGWFNPGTNGQGFVMDVFDNVNQMFVAWFTYDLERPDPGTEALIGDPGHRWLTAQGPFSGDTGNLPIYWTTGGVFDMADPAPGQPTQDGSLTVEFFDCVSGQVTYDLGSNNASGVVPIQRLANDATDLCESQYSGPGQPGPL